MTKSRWLVAVLVLILAALATVGVFLYSRGEEQGPMTGEPMVPVVVSEVNIPARTDLNELIKDDQFRIILVPEDVVDGAVTSIDQLRDGRNRLRILAGELMHARRIKGV